MNSIKIYSVFLTVVFLNISHSHHGMNLNAEDKISVQKYFASLLKTLVKLNDERLKTIKNLYMLNRINFGKALRSSIRTDNDYDEIIKSIEAIVSLLSNKDDITYLIDDKNVGYTNIARGGTKYSGSEENNSKNDVSKARNDKNSRAYYYLVPCGKPVLRCMKACYDSCWKACFIEESCSDDFVKDMREQCEDSCRSRFDPYYSEYYFT